MTDEKRTAIPSRIYNAANGGHVCGAEDVIDDEIGLTQDKINSIVLGKAITVGLDATSPVFVGEGRSISLAATISTDADHIYIYRGSYSAKPDGVSPIASLSDSATNRKALSYADTIDAVDGNNYYTAVFEIGDMTKVASKSCVGVRPISTGHGADYAHAAMTEENTPHAAGSFTKRITTAAQDHIFIEVPDNFRLSALALVSTYDTSLAFTEIPTDKTGYRAYQNTEERGAGTFTYRITVANN